MSSTLTRIDLGGDALSVTDWKEKEYNMITSNNSRLFGLSRFGAMKGSRFGCVVTTAPEGTFKGYSTVFSPFDPRLDWLDAKANGHLNPMAKALLHPCSTKAGRAEVHKIFLEELDKPEAQELGFAGTIAIALSRAKKQGAIIDFIVHPAITEATGKLPQEVQARMVA
jgi:hypothetical protein